MWMGTKEDRAKRYSMVESAVLVAQRMRKERGWSPAKPGDLHYEDYSCAAKSDTYLNALRVAYGYSVTVHNAQGGEWPVVFVDPASNKARDWQHDTQMSFARWVYTASTRAKDALWFIKHTVQSWRCDRAPSSQSGEQPLAIQGVVCESLRDHCVMDFSQSVMPTLLALAVIGTLLLVAFQAAA